MEKYIEVRWHGRAQQGVVTAAKLLAEAALREGKYVQAFPEFGPERMGAPVRAYNRISDKPIRLHCQVKNPDIVLIVDPTLIGTRLSGGCESQGSLSDGVKDDSIFIVNTTKPSETMRRELGLDGKGKVFTIDASRISMDKIGRHLPNTVMLGALAKATSVIGLSSLIDNFRENYSKKFPQKVVEGNIEAMKKGFEEVKGNEKG